MAEQADWAFPLEMRPRPEDWRFDLDAALDSVVQLRAEIPEDAFTAPILGTERAGNVIVIREDGLVLTIGYLITEASTIWLTTNQGVAAGGYPLAYDQATGFGRVQRLGRLGTRALERGTSASCRIGENVVVAGHGGRAHALKARVIAKREFAGYWEYVLDEALFTAPAHPEWSGAALLDESGRLVGIGSLLVQETVGEQTVQGNMFVPADLLDPLLDDLLKFGRSSRPARPWLGMYTAEVANHLIVNGLAKDGPGDAAGVRLGDVVVDVGGEHVSGLGDLYRKIWRRGPPGTTIPLTLTRDGGIVRTEIRSADRSDFLKKPQLQ